ncbi:hypothetical protein [Microcoleus vaginatus]|uniref:hypothetical protein n=1 Tax=Microcoleus vaginatus TaxID=119532 RepID=UPI00403FB9FC
MITSQKWRSATAAILALGITVGTSAPLVVATPAEAQQRISQFDSIRIPSGSVIPVSYEKDKILVTREETAPLTLTVARDIRTPQGRVLIPGGSQIVGTLQPVRRGNQIGTQFVARELIISRRQRYRIDGYSGIITRNRKSPKRCWHRFISARCSIGCSSSSSTSRHYR